MKAGQGQIVRRSKGATSGFPENSIHQYCGLLCRLAGYPEDTRRFPPPPAERAPVSRGGPRQWARPTSRGPLRPQHGGAHLDAAVAALPRRHGCFSSRAFAGAFGSCSLC